ncbi:MAG: rhodanese-like domain-containing protein [Acetobacteraceae bacterium]
MEHARDTPHIEAAALKQRLDAGEDILLLDSRPFDEFQVMSIPGGIDAPGVELVGRAHALLRSPDTQVVVNCAGRTRSIIGAQLLINAGLPNPVAALKDGTMGLAPRRLAPRPWPHGAGAPPRPGGAGRGAARGPGDGRAVRRAQHRPCRPRRVRGGGGPAFAIPLRRAHTRGLRGRAPAGLPPRRRRPTGAGDGRLCRHPARADRAGGR